MTQRLCTRCQKPYLVADQTLPNAAKDYTPFCSKRCADVDLIHWLQGDYVIDGSGALSIDQDEPDASEASSPKLSSSFDEDDER